MQYLSAISISFRLALCETLYRAMTVTLGLKILFSFTRVSWKPSTHSDFVTFFFFPKLALFFYLILLSFCNVLQKVCDCLLRKGALTLANIIRFAELPPQQVKSCILVLIQHNCVQPYAMQQEGIAILISGTLVFVVSC